MTKRKSKADSKVAKVMREWKEGTLHQGKSRRIVRNRKQAIAIAMRMSGKSRGR